MLSIALFFEVVNSQKRYGVSGSLFSPLHNQGGRAKNGVFRRATDAAERASNAVERHMITSRAVEITPYIAFTVLHVCMK